MGPWCKGAPSYSDLGWEEQLRPYPSFVGTVKVPYSARTYRSNISGKYGLEILPWGLAFFW